ncbi:unnamed protein product [Coregonus sp. 'balchen']|nr:unnamed protein product [Coregonus sp. 'balchen']
MAAVAVKEGCADSVPTPTILLDPGYIDVAMPVVVRCESTEGTKCHFYKDHDPNPIRTVNSGVCQFILFWNEFKKWNKTEAKHAGTSCYYYLDNSDSPFKKQPYKDNVCVGKVAEKELLRKRSSAGELFITCAVELVMEGEDTVKSQHSEPFKITIDREDIN